MQAAQREVEADAKEATVITLLTELDAKVQVRVCVCACVVHSAAMSSRSRHGQLADGVRSMCCGVDPARPGLPDMSCAYGAI